MIHNPPLRLVTILLAVLFVGVIGASLVQADTSNAPNAVTTIETNLRTGPGRQYDTIVVLPTNTPLVLEGRSADLVWLLAHTPDNNYRGWAARKLLKVNPDVRVRDLPVLNIIVTPGTVTPNSGALVPTNAPTYVPNTRLDGPIVPDIPQGVRDSIQAIYNRGQSLGNNSHVFIKVGDCMTYRWTFLNVFGYGQYDLGKYGDLKGIISYFNAPVRADVPNSWVVKSVAAANGFNSAAVLDPEWSDPALCKAQETPLQCEIRINKP
ncbi:MAG TPA: hypothetical protein VMT34_01705, partial [Aggregatilineales bacterium]|nr:hypothetical protein [Aggregatilineales bacterium]